MASRAEGRSAGAEAMHPEMRSAMGWGHCSGTLLACTLGETRDSDCSGLIRRLLGCAHIHGTRPRLQAPSHRLMQASRSGSSQLTLRMPLQKLMSACTGRNSMPRNVSTATWAHRGMLNCTEQRPHTLEWGRGCAVALDQSQSREG